MRAPAQLPSPGSSQTPPHCRNGLFVPSRASAIALERSRDSRRAHRALEKFRESKATLRKVDRHAAEYFRDSTATTRESDHHEATVLARKFAAAIRSMHGRARRRWRSVLHGVAHGRALKVGGDDLDLRTAAPPRGGDVPFLLAAFVGDWRSIGDERDRAGQHSTATPRSVRSTRPRRDDSNQNDKPIQ